MHIYYVKEDDFLYRFKTYSDLETLTGKKRTAMKDKLAEAVRQFFPKAEMSSQMGALWKGWIDLNGNAVPSLKQGNEWSTPRKYRTKNYRQNGINEDQGKAQ